MKSFSYIDPTGDRRSPRTSSREARHCCRAGVTLVDLVITVMIVAILAAVAMPRFASTVSRLRTEAVARRIASDLNFARRTAIQTSRTTSVTFAAAPAGYTMTGVEHPAYPSQAYVVAVADIDGSVALQSFNFDGGPVLSFNTYGRPLVGSNALAVGAVVVASGGHALSVVVDPSTGETSVP